MKIKIKYNTIIFEKESEWDDIRDQIKKDFGQLIFTISWKLKRELGFTVRYHRGLAPWNDDETKMYYQNQVHLDFYTESAQSWFLLKYVNIDEQ